MLDFQPFPEQMRSAGNRLLAVREALRTGEHEAFIEHDGEYDDIFMANSILPVLAQHPNITKINIVTNAGNSAFVLILAQKELFIEKIKRKFSDKIAEKFNILDGAADKDTVLSVRHQLSPDVKAAMDRSSIFISSCQAVNVAEYMLGNYPIDADRAEKLLYQRIGGVNDEWTAKYLAAHFAPAGLAGAPKKAWSIEKTYAMARDVAQETILLQRFLMEALFGQQLWKGRPLSRAFGNISPDFYPLLCALLLDAASQKYGTKMGQLFVHSAKLSNINLLEKWGRLIPKALQREQVDGVSLFDQLLTALDPRQVSEQTLASFRNDPIKFLQTQLIDKPLHEIDHICDTLKKIVQDRPRMEHPERPGDMDYDLKGDTDRFARVVREYSYQTLWCDQANTGVIKFLLGNNSNPLLTSCLSEHRYAGVSPNGFATRLPTEPGDPMAFLEVVDPKVSLSLQSQASGIIDGLYFRSAMEAEMIEGCLDYAAEHSPARALAVRFLNAWNTFIHSGADINKLNTREYGRFEGAAEEIRAQAEARIPKAMALIQDEQQQQAALDGDRSAAEEYSQEEVYAKPPLLVQYNNNSSSSSSSSSSNSGSKRHPAPEEVPDTKRTKIRHV